MSTFSYTLPVVGGSQDTWGTTLNSNWTNLGTFLGSLDSAELAVLDGITATTAELNYVDGVTSNIQTQIDTLTSEKAALSGANFTGAVDVNATLTANALAIDNGASDWSLSVSGNNLFFNYAGVAKMKLDTSGNLFVIGNITAYQTSPLT